MRQRVLFTRREFLRTASLVAVGASMPRFLVDVAEAAQKRVIPGFHDDRILVVVQLGGGNDGLNTLVPYADDAYYRARPQLALQPNTLVHIDDHVGLHPSLVGLKKLYDRGLACVVEGVGYPNPNRSHFRSMEIWHTASDADKVESTGWIGRYLDACCSGEGEPVAAVAMMAEKPQAFFGKRGLGVAVSNPATFRWQRGPAGATEERFRAVNDPNATAANSNLAFLRHVVADAVLSSQRVQEVAKKSHTGVTYPDDAFGAALRTVAQMIVGGLPTRIYYVGLSGFDTHARQLETHARLLGQFGGGLEAFWRDLEEQGQADRVLVMTFSEFGRRVSENASAGTDHGTAQPMFLVGRQITAGLAGRRPSLTQLDNGDLVATTDFRSVYATVLEHWLGADSRLVLGREFPRLALIPERARALPVRRGASA